MPKNHLPTSAGKSARRERASGKVKKVFIIEDHPVSRDGLTRIIASEKGLEVCGQVGSAMQGAEAIAKLKPDLVLLSVSLPDRNVLEVLKRIRAVHSAVKVLVLSMQDEAIYATGVLRAGGDGYIVKTEDPDEIVTAIKNVLSGQLYVSEAVLARQTHKPTERNRPRSLSVLSDSQLQILALLGHGASYPEIAKRLRLSPLAVSSGCKAIRKVLRLKSENALIRYAVCWIELGIK